MGRCRSRRIGAGLDGGNRQREHVPPVDNVRALHTGRQEPTDQVLAGVGQHAFVGLFALHHTQLPLPVLDAFHGELGERRAWRFPHARVQPLGERALEEEPLERGHQLPILPVGKTRLGTRKHAVHVAAVGEEVAAVAKGELGEGVKGPEAEPVVQDDGVAALAHFVEPLDQRLEGLVHLVFLLEPGRLGKAGRDFGLYLAHAGLVLDRDESEGLLALDAYDHGLVGGCLDIWSSDASSYKKKTRDDGVVDYAKLANIPWERRLWFRI